jgi:F-type H+-transporting ATPase subunit b
MSARKQQRAMSARKQERAMSARNSWLAAALLLLVGAAPCLVQADEHEAEMEAGEAANETSEDGHHGGHLTLHSILQGEEKMQFWGSIVNFALLVYLIRRMSKAPLQKFLSERSDLIERGIADAAELKRSAEAIFNEYTERMKTLDRELAKLRQDVAQAAERDRVRIVAEAEESVARLKAETSELVSRQAEQLEAQIRREVVAAAAEAAERAVRETSTPEDQRRLAEAFVRELEKNAKTGPAGSSTHQNAPHARAEKVA